MEKMLILGFDSSTRHAVDACRQRGVHTIITDYLTPEQNPAKLYSDEYWMISYADIDALEKKCREEGVTAVYAGNQESCLDAVQLLTARLGLPFYATDLSWEIARDKALFKQYCRESGIPVAKSYDMEKAIDPEILKTMEYPVVVKPVDQTAMKGFAICRNEEEFLKAYDRAMGFSASKRVIVEEYLTGMEFQLTGVALDGEVTFFCYHNVHKYEVAGNQVMVAAMPFDPAKDDCCTVEFVEQAKELAKKMQIRNGAFFFQGIRKNGRACLIELAARIDGAGLWAVYKNLMGYDIVGFMVDLARGVKPEHNFAKLDYSLKGRCFAEYGLWIRPGIVKEVLGEDVIDADPRIDITLRRFRPGDEVTAAGNMTQMGWYITFIADSKEELFEIYEKLNSNLKIISTEDENLAIYYHNYTEIQI